MITLTPLAGAIVASMMALWLVIAIWATLSGLRRRAAADACETRAARFGALLASAPAVPIVVLADGRLQTSERLIDWLDLARMPQSVAELADGDGNGLSPEDAEQLGALVADAQRSAGRFSREFTVRRSDRRLLLQARPAPAALGGTGTLLVWVFDATESARSIAELGEESTRLSVALDALSALIEAAPIPMWHRSNDLRLSLVNAAYVRAVEGDDAGEVVSRGLELVDGEGGRSPQAVAALAQAEARIMARNVPATIAGERRMLRLVDVPLGPSGIAGYAVDVQELEQARADLARFVRAQRDMLDRLSAGVAQFGPDHGLVFSNQPFQRIFGIPPDWLAETPEFDRVLERMRERQRLPESRDFPGWKAERRAWFNATLDPIEENWLLPGGAHIRVVAQPLPDGGLLLIFEDRTEQLQLASSRDTLLRVRTATFDNLFEAVGVFAADGRLRIWNNRFREVWDLDEAVLADHPRVDVLVERVARRLSNPSRASLIRELVRIATVERHQRSGRVQLVDGRHFEFAAVPLPDGNALFTMLDVTDSRRVEAALRASNEALAEADRIKSAFVANISYELRTPLTSIAGFAEMLAGGYAGALGPEQKDYVASILDAVGGLSMLIDDVLDLTQSEASALPIASEAVALAPIVKGVVDRKRPAAEGSGVELEAVIDDLVGVVQGDGRRLAQAIENSVEFALAETPRGGRVLLRATGTADEAELVISDNGTGMNAKEQAGVFTRLGQTGVIGNETIAQSLAMPLTRRFVEAHGGSVALFSQPGEGSTITLRIPRQRHPA